MINLYPHQREAVDKMHNGCILCGDVGSGKSRTALAYYYQLNGGQLDCKDFVKMKDPMDLYVITTARKRDELDWEKEFLPFFISPDPKYSIYKDHTVAIDSWNNIKKYESVQGAFFIFDEQRLVGYGAWAQAFFKIAKNNNWILLSATPGDTWSEYMTVFIANGFFKNKTEFTRNHVIYKPFTNFPQIDHYIGEWRLIRLRDRILIPMDDPRKTVCHYKTIRTEYDSDMYKQIQKTRWDPWKNAPIETSSALCFLLRKIPNMDISKTEELRKIVAEKSKTIVFYNYDYELDILRKLDFGKDVEKAEWNGHKHQPIPEKEKWVYFVQYTSGCEGWNCIKTDTIVFYSLNYSYKVMAQACGRINRLNTPYTDLYYYYLRSTAPIDGAIQRALNAKKRFNERKFVDKL